MESEKIKIAHQQIDYDLQNKIASDSEARKFLKCREDLADKSHVLCGKKVVFTGDLNSLSREEAWRMAWEIGADINTSISPKINYVIVGNNAGHSKLEKIIDLLAEGREIIILNEQRFLKLFNLTEEQKS